MSDVRVNPPSVRAYGTSAQETFGNIRASLDSLCADVVGVDYYGPNAVAFKTKCGTMASELANALIKDIGGICDAVKTTTSAIAGSLGGPPVDIQFNGTPVTAPAVPAGDESVGANLPALEGMKTTAAKHFGDVSEQFTNHLASLQKTDWVGTAKENAVTAVDRFTKSAKSKVEDAKTEMSNYITEQIELISKANK